MGFLFLHILLLLSGGVSRVIGRFPVLLLVSPFVARLVPHLFTPVGSILFDDLHYGVFEPTLESFGLVF
jgi:hypothetical protein